MIYGNNFKTIILVLKKKKHFRKAPVQSTNAAQAAAPGCTPRAHIARSLPARSTRLERLAWPTPCTCNTRPRACLARKARAI